MPASFSASPTESTQHSVVEFRANGEISRMRSHKGNMPSLPQNKFCTLCPAKFTRTTHLNRHFRSHTNERSHRCDACHAEFTRSDLLTRHKRTCGDSRNQQRSRRKSCQSCAESKVKCNLEYPCSKCVARGRECVFVNDPETSRNRKAAKKQTPSRPEINTDLEGPFSNSPSSPLYTRATSSPQSPYSVMYEYPSPINTVPSPIIDPLPLPNQLDNMSYGLPSLYYSSSSSASSSRPSSRLEPFDLLPNLMNLNFDDLETNNSQLDDFFPIPSQQQHQQHSTFFQGLMDASPYERLVPGQTYSVTGNDQSFSYHQPLAISTSPNVTIDSTAALNSPSFPVPSSHGHHFTPASVPDHNNTAFESSASSHVSDPEAEELEHYLTMFFSAFSLQLPLVHRPTWSMTGKHPMLVSAMHVCGAVFVRSDTALNYVRRTLSYLRDNLILEFSKSDCSMKDRFSLIVAVALLQSLGLLWRQPDQSAATKAFHGLLITMIRKLGLVKIMNSWSPPDLSNPYALDTAWREWARYETLKRVVSLAYVQDCSYCVFFSWPPLLHHPSETDMVKLPCDDALWNAESAKEWYQMVHTASTYGAGPRRLASITIQQALFSLDVPLPVSDVQARLNPFSQFIIIHTILRNIYSSSTSSSNPNSNSPSLSNPSPPNLTFLSGSHPTGPSSGSGSSALSSESTGKMSNEGLLHNWLQMWTHNSEGLLSKKFGEQQHLTGLASSTSPSFVSQSLPFYWLARYTIFATQEGLLDLQPSMTDLEAQTRCRLISSWLNYINAYLEKGYQLPPRIQDFASGPYIPQAQDTPFFGSRSFDFGCQIF